MNISLGNKALLLYPILSLAQNTVVVERWWQVPLSKEGRPPRLYPRRHRVYKVVEDTKHAPKEKMELILSQTVASTYACLFFQYPDKDIT